MSRRKELWTLALGGAVALAAVLTDGSALAGDAATAEILFREGKRLMDKGQYTEACPKLAESYRIDPATGTLLALALCHQDEGKLASAWTEYQEVVSRARKEARLERVKVASGRAAALEKRLSVLAVNVTAEAAKVTGLEVKRDGTVLGQAAWGLSVPMDGGEHIVEASAPGRKPWSRKVTLASEKDEQEVAVPVLEEAGTASSVGSSSPIDSTTTAEPAKAPAEPAVTPAPREAGEKAHQDPPTSRSSWIPTLGWTGIGVGTAAVVTGAVLALTAKSSYNDAMQHCGSNIGAPSNSLCEPAYTGPRNSAVSRASAATWLVTGGAVMAAAGVGVIVAGSGRKTDAPRAALHLVPSGALLEGEF